MTGMPLSENRPVLILAHGAGAPMDSPFMATIADLIEGNGIRVKRFEFNYMATRRTTGRKPPPPRAERLMAEFQRVIYKERGRTIFIGGKSLGGRVASMIAQDNHAAGHIKGLVCLGFPFHPPGRPETLRTAHLREMTCPALIVQGENDPFGKRVEVESYGLPTAITVNWINEANHDLITPKRAGATQNAAWREVARHVHSFVSLNA